MPKKSGQSSKQQKGGTNKASGANPSSTTAPQSLLQSSNTTTQMSAPVASAAMISQSQQPSQSLLLPESTSLPLGGSDLTKSFFLDSAQVEKAGASGTSHGLIGSGQSNSHGGRGGHDQTKGQNKTSYMTKQNGENWLQLTQQLKLKYVNIDVEEARQLNKQCQKNVLMKETNMFEMLEFDFGVFIFAVFQLALTNLIVFKGNWKYMDTDLIMFSVIMLSRRLLCKANHYHQVNIYRMHLIFFTILRTIPLVLILVLSWLFFKIIIFNSTANIICVLLPSIMHCMVFGVPQGLFQISSSAFMAHPIFNTEAERQSKEQKDAQGKDDGANKGSKSGQQSAPFVSTSYQNRRKNSHQAAQAVAAQQQQQTASNGEKTENFGGKDKGVLKFKMDQYYFEFSNMARYASAKDEFSHILRSIYFNAVEVIYYTGFLPVKFIRTETQLHFDSWLVVTCVINCLGMMLTLTTSHYLYKRAVEMQFNAKMCGQWIKVPKPNKTGAMPIQEWRPHTSYPQGTIVSLNRSHHLKTNEPLKGTTSQTQQSWIASQATSNANIQQQTYQVQQQQQQTMHQQQQQQQQNLQQSSQVEQADESGSANNAEPQLDYFMSTGTLGNRSQPDDVMSHLLYLIFNEPKVTVRSLQKFALINLSVLAIQVVMMRNKTMIPFMIINFLLCSVYVHVTILCKEDFMEIKKREQMKAKRVEKYFDFNEKRSQLLDNAMDQMLFGKIEEKEQQPAPAAVKAPESNEKAADKSTDDQLKQPKSYL